jgi:hypothetical protein
MHQVSASIALLIHERLASVLVIKWSPRSRITAIAASIIHTIRERLQVGWWRRFAANQISNFLHNICKSTVNHTIESFAHDSGRALARAEYGYPKGSPNTSS